MVSLLPIECLEKIFLNLILINPSHDTFFISTNIYKTKDLYTCTLVSRYWCQVSTSHLYRYPFHHFRHLKNNKKSQQIEKDVQDFYKLIRTLLTCIPQTEIEKIVDSVNERSLFTELILYSLKRSPTFNYVKFIRGLHFDAKFFEAYSTLIYKKIWMPSYLSINAIPEIFTSEFCYAIINCLVKYLSENCGNLTGLEIKPFILYDERLYIDPLEILLKTYSIGSKEN